MGIRGKAVVTVLTTAGPIVYEMVRKYWPTVKRALEDNPELLRNVQDQLRRLSAARHSGHTSDSIRERIAILREQVDYLQASADNPLEANAATSFRAQLDRFEVSVNTANAASTAKERNRDLRLISDNLDRLTEKILIAFVEEKAADSQGH